MFKLPIGGSLLRHFAVLTVLVQVGLLVEGIGALHR